MIIMGWALLNYSNKKIGHSIKAVTIPMIEPVDACKVV